MTVPLNLHFADPTFLPVCHYPVFCTYPAAMIGPKEMRTGQGVMVLACPHRQTSREREMRTYPRDQNGEQ